MIVDKIKKCIQINTVFHPGLAKAFDNISNLELIEMETVATRSIIKTFIILFQTKKVNQRMKLNWSSIATILIFNLY